MSALIIDDGVGMINILNVSDIQSVSFKWSGCPGLNLYPVEIKGFGVDECVVRGMFCKEVAEDVTKKILNVVNNGKDKNKVYKINIGEVIDKYHVKMGENRNKEKRLFSFFRK